MPNTCILCKKSNRGKSQVKMMWFPSEKIKRKRWLEAIDLSETDISPNSPRYSKHFRNGDVTLVPCLGLGKRFYSPKKRESVKRLCFDIVTHLSHSF